MNLFETLKKKVPDAGPNTSSRFQDAQLKLDLLKANGYSEQATIFENAINSKIENGDFETIGGDLSNLAIFYDGNYKKEGSGVAQTKAKVEEDNKKAEEIRAATLLLETSKENLTPEQIVAIRNSISESPGAAIAAINKVAVTPTVADVEKQKEKATAKQQARNELRFNLKEIDRFVQKGKPTQTLDEAVGYGEGAATFMSEYVPFLGTQSPEEVSDQKRAMTLLEADLLDKVALLRPASDSDIRLLQVNRPQIHNPPEVWVNYLSRMKKSIQQMLDEPDTTDATTDSNTTTLGQQLLDLPPIK